LTVWSRVLVSTFYGFYGRVLVYVSASDDVGRLDSKGNTLAMQGKLERANRQPNKAEEEDKQTLKNFILQCFMSFWARPIQKKTSVLLSTFLGSDMLGGPLKHTFLAYDRMVSSCENAHIACKIQISRVRDVV